MSTFEKNKEKFNVFYNKIKSLHEESPLKHRGHGFDHDITVAQLAVIISPEERAAEKAWCSGMLHSLDRLIGNSAKELEKMIREILLSAPQNYFSDKEITEITEAVLRHSEVNKADQSLTQQILMDADRLANMQPAVIIRAGQFRPDIPAFEFNFLDKSVNPQSTHNEPRSVLDDLRHRRLMYIPQMRLPKAIEMAEKYTSYLDEYIRKIEEVNKEIGLLNLSL